MTTDRKTAEKLIYRHTHKDFKGNGCILVLRQGGTHSVPMSGLTDAEIADKLPYAMKQEEKRLAKKNEKTA